MYPLASLIHPFTSCTAYNLDATGRFWLRNQKAHKCNTDAQNPVVSNVPDGLPLGVVQVAAQQTSKSTPVAVLTNVLV